MKEIDDARQAADEEITKRNASLKDYREKLAKLEADIHLAEVLSGGGGAAGSSGVQKDPLQAQLDSLMQVRALPALATNFHRGTSEQQTGSPTRAERPTPLQALGHSPIAALLSHLCHARIPLCTAAPAANRRFAGSQIAPPPHNPPLRSRRRRIRPAARVGNAAKPPRLALTREIARGSGSAGPAGSPRQDY